MGLVADTFNQVERFFGGGEPIPAVEGSADDLDDFDGFLPQPEPVQVAPNPGDISGLRIAGNASGLLALGLIGAAAWLIWRR